MSQNGRFGTTWGSQKCVHFWGKRRNSGMSEPRRTGAVRDMQLVTPSGGRTCGAAFGLSLRASDAIKTL